MSDEQARTTDETEAVEFHVPLEPNGDGRVMVEDESEDEATGAEESAGTPEQTEQTEELLSAEDAGVNENDPAYQALRKKFLAAYNRKLEAERKKLKPQETAVAQPEAETPKAAAAQPEAQATGDPVDDVFNVDFGGFKPELKFREGSDLADYADELSEVIQQANIQAVKYALEAVKRNDQAFRQQMAEQERVGKARGVIESYAKEIMDHPEYAEKAAAMQDFAVKTRAIAVDDPELWVEMAEKKFGLVRGWKGEADEQRTAQTAQIHRLATKSRATVTRPSAARSLSPVANGKMSVDEAFEAAWKTARR